MFCRITDERLDYIFDLVGLKPFTSPYEAVVEDMDDRLTVKIEGIDRDNNRAAYTVIHRYDGEQGLIVDTTLPHNLIKREAVRIIDGLAMSACGIFRKYSFQAEAPLTWRPIINSDNYTNAWNEASATLFAHIADIMPRPCIKTRPVNLDIFRFDPCQASMLQFLNSLSPH